MHTVIPNFARARYLVVLGGALAAAVWLGAATAQTSDPETIAEMLRDGGYVLVMRHASSPREAPDARRADARNENRERQLDENGRAHSTAVGYAFRQLGVEIGEVLSSPAFRAHETALYLGYDAESAEQLAAGGNNADWLRRKAGEPPEAGTNRLMITHAPSIQAAFGEAAAGMEDGETLVVRPENGEARVVGRLTTRDWAVLAVERSGS